jgi:hypothetical protein
LGRASSIADEVLLDQPTISPPSPAGIDSAPGGITDENVLKLVPPGYQLVPVNLNIGKRYRRSWSRRSCAAHRSECLSTVPPGGNREQFPAVYVCFTRDEVRSSRFYRIAKQRADAIVFFVLLADNCIAHHSS